MQLQIHAETSQVPFYLGIISSVAEGGGHQRARARGHRCLHCTQLGHVVGSARTTGGSHKGTLSLQWKT